MNKFTKPRCIISDHDAAFLSNEFSSYLDKLQIPLNVNALGDHHVLGIIDNFAKRIKTILTAMFLKNNNTRWFHVLENIINHYNRSETYYQLLTNKEFHLSIQTVFKKASS